MKRILVGIILFAISAYGQSSENCPLNKSLGELSVMPESIANEKQILELALFAEELIAQQVPPKNLFALWNEKLSELGLPLLNDKHDIRYTIFSTFVELFPIGIQARDDKHVYCVPCGILHNYFITGIFTYETTLKGEQENANTLCEVYEQR